MITNMSISIPEKCFGNWFHTDCTIRPTKFKYISPSIILPKRQLRRSWPERLRLKRAVAHLQISLGPLGCAGFVEWPAKLFVEHHVRWNGQRLIHAQGVAQSHHLQTHGRDREIDLYRLGRHVSDALDDLETFIEQLIDGDNFVYQADQLLDE